MRRQLIRSTLLAIAVSVCIVGVPVMVLGLLALNRRADHLTGLQMWLDERQADGHIGWLLIGFIVLHLLLGTAAGVAVASTQARKFSEPMSSLADRAEQLGAGESRFTPMDSGIEEIDRVSDVLSRSAQQLKRSLASERDFASDASHQLRTPLTALLMRLEEITVTDEIEVMHEEAAVAISQVERLTKVVDELLARSRRSSEAAGVSVSLDSVIASLQREWQPAFEGARRSVRVDGERGLWVQATPSALSQVVSTLLENSLSHGCGTVDVLARRSGPSVVLEVSDQGEGVPATLAPHIFERSVSSGKSTGLGLALARDLAEANGGRLELRQARPAVFSLFLSEGEAG